MKKYFLLASLLCLSNQGYAIPIEQRSLSTATPPPATTLEQGQQLWETKQEVERLQNQVRQLLGKFEEQEYRIEELNKELQNRYTDLDQRLEILNQQINETEPNSDESESNTVPEDGTSSGTTTTATQTKDLDQAAYNAAYEAYQAGGSTKAIPLMIKFIEDYPNSPYISHAHFWLGEFNLQLNPKKIHEARDNFEVVVGNYPDSTKAPTALYRLIEIAMKIDQDTVKARSLYQQLIQKYSSSNEAQSARTNFGL